MKRIVCFVLLAGLAGCGSPVKHPDVQSVLDRQVESWNAGDLDSYMQTYWRSDDLVFSTSSGETKGWDETLARYKRSYPTRQAMGQLQFEEIEIAQTGESDAVVSGKFVLTLAKGRETGRFYLTLRLIDGQWVIVRDYTVGD